jgi:aspartate racemase
MKTIGIVGGIAWPSTIVYYRAINQLVARRRGGTGLHSAKLVLAQTDFAEIERHQREGRWDLVGDLLAQQANKLKAAGADFFLLACNTVHTADEQSNTRSTCRSFTSSTPPGERLSGAASRRSAYSAAATR